jgi:outer membrane lipoprotein-sorting protein
MLSVGPRIVVVILLVVTGVILTAGCPKSGDEAPVDAAAIVAATVAQQNTRLSAVRDYEVEGEVVDQASQTTLKFRYAMQQPSYSVGELLDGQGARARAFIFDGKVLATVDDQQKVIIRQDLSKDEEALLFTLHSIFSQFVCEGWRPPLLKPQGMIGREEAGNLVLEVPIADERLAQQRLTFKKDGSFVGKQLLDKQGQVLVSTLVLEDVADAATGLRFPKRWRHSEDGTTQEVTLTRVAINGGVDPARFSTATPAGFTDRSAP